VSTKEVLSQRATTLVHRLKTRKGRRREALVLVEGVRAVTAALDGGARLRLGVVSDRLEGRPGGRELKARLGDLGVEVRHVSDSELAALSDTETPQGVLLVAEERDVPLGAFVPGRWLVLDGVQDPGNAGTLVRAAVAFGLDGVVALDGTVDLWSPKAVRASAGLGFRIPIGRSSSRALLEICREAGVALLVADPAGADVGGVDLSGPVALVMGNEGAGACPELVRAAEAIVAVPMHGPAESLNVGVAGSVLLYALSRERRRA
jgi:TrmH family RNA methyltransferase